jgi:hypothetical protein
MVEYSIAYNYFQINKNNCSYFVENCVYLLLKGETAMMLKYSSISLPEQMAKKIRKMHKAYQPMMLLSGFVNEMITTYFETHCPECHEDLTVKTETCSCKLSERS